MEENKKRSRKTKLVPREYLDSDDENIAQMQNEIEETISKINVQSILKKLEPKYFSSKSLEFSVKVEVEECNDNIEVSSDSDNQTSEDLNIKIDSIRSLNEEETIGHYQIDDDHLREVFYSQSQKTISTVDKMIEIHIRNQFGRRKVYIVESNVDKMLRFKLQKWKVWYESFSHLRDVPSMYICYVCSKGWWHFSEFREHLKTHDILNYTTETHHEEFRIVAYKRVPKSDNVIQFESDCWKCGRDASVHQQPEYRCRGCYLEQDSCTMLCSHEINCMKYKRLLGHTGIDMSHTYYCPLCPYKHWVEDEIQKHLVLRHSVRSDLPIYWNTISCLRCNTVYNDHRVHECLHRPMMHSCRFCKMTFQVLAALRYHWHNSKNKVSCKICNKKLLRGCMLPEHLLFHTSNYIGMFKCLLCNESLYFANYISKIAHKKSVHADAHRKQVIFEKVIVPTKILEVSKRMVSLAEVTDTDTDNSNKQNEIVENEELGDSMKERDYFQDELGIKVTVIDKSTVQKLMNDANVDILDVNTDENETMTTISTEAIDNTEQTVDNNVGLTINPSQKTLKKEDIADEIEQETVEQNVEIKQEILDDIEILDENVINDMKLEVIDDSVIELNTKVKMETDDEVNGDDDDEAAYEAAAPDEPKRKRKRTAYNHTKADRSNRRTRSKVLIEAQGASSTSATPFAEPLTVAAPKTKLEKRREYRRRVAASKTAAELKAERKLQAEKKRKYKQRLAVARVNGLSESTQIETSAAEPGTSSDQIQREQYIWNKKWASSILRFKLVFLDNDFGYACSVCDRLWFKNELKPITVAQMEVISEWFSKENRRLCREEYEMVCNTCRFYLNKKTMPLLAKVNGFTYPDRPPGLPPLDPISERLISPCLPFMQVRRLRQDSSNGILGQVINVPAVRGMFERLPRQLNEDDVINLNIERNFAHESLYISGHMSESTISAWLTVLQKSPLYRLYEINVDLSTLNFTVQFLYDIHDDPSNRIENISADNTPESEILASRQHTLMWNEEDCLNAPGRKVTSIDLIYDRNVEELSFPSIYFGESRRFNWGKVCCYSIADSEIRRRDRRGATPEKILYVALKLLRHRIAHIARIISKSRNVSVTRRMLEDTEFREQFMKAVPNSVQYWASRKRDLLAIIRQLGKPTVFLTISVNEIRWMKLLTILLKLSEKYPGKTAKDLNTSERCTLVSDDPVTCCIYFSKLISCLMKMLISKRSYNPFGKYSVKDYFIRFEFHQGSPHAHVLLWLNDDPRETVSEKMPKTIKLMKNICSVARNVVPNDSVYANQIHKHTSTCTKRGETTCRFGIPYWPMLRTRVLVPIPQSDRRRQTLQQKANELRTSLGERRYECMDEFLNANGLTHVSYLKIVRSTLRRPTLLFKRNFDELMTNTFNPFIAGEVNANIDIQFILDEYSCAEYVEKCVNKSTLGMSNLRRELTTMMQEHPDRDFTRRMNALSIKLLNAFEMTAQEAACYLLRQPMSEASRQVVYIPTVWPTERQRYHKSRKQMDREGINEDSTNVWNKNIIQRYEERPVSLEQVYLAEFASWYAKGNDLVDEEDDVQVVDDEDSEAAPQACTWIAPKKYQRRSLGRVIRYRGYDIDDTDNYKREMVLLYVDFRDEWSEIVHQNNFLQLFDDNKDTIMERHSLFETGFNIDNVRPEQP